MAFESLQQAVIDAGAEAIVGGALPSQPAPMRSAPTAKPPTPPGPSFPASAARLREGRAQAALRSGIASCSH